MERAARNGWEYGRLHRMSAAWSLLVSLLMIVGVFTLWLRGVQIADEGMAPTLRAGDVVLFDAWSQHLKTPARGDIYGVKTDAGVKLGRVIGLPGERVEIDNGNVYINGIFLSERAYAQYADVDMEEVVLGKSEFFLLPDSRPYMALAPGEMTVPAEALFGRAALRVSPLSSFCFL